MRNEQKYRLAVTLEVEDHVGLARAAPAQLAAGFTLNKGKLLNDRTSNWNVAL